MKLRMYRNSQEKDRHILEGNTIRGYVDKNDDLYGFKSDGYACLITTNVNEHNAISKLKRWLKNNYDKT